MILNENEIINSLKEGMIDAALFNLERLFGQQTQIFESDIVLFYSRWNQIQNENINGLISQSDLRVEKQKISHSIIKWINRAKREELSKICYPLLNNFSDPKISLSALKEEILWKNQLQDVSWLEIGTRMSKSVCRILVYPENGNPKCGTGFIGEKNKLYTCNHVLQTIENCRNARIQFTYTRKSIQAKKTPVDFKLNPDNFFITNSRLDYTVVSIQGETNLAPLPRSKNTPLKYDGCPIIQHPKGGFKKIGIHNNVVMLTKGHSIYYTTDTEPGSSGSPVFDEKWNVIGIHNAYQGELFCENEKRTIANRGTLMKDIMSDLDRRQITPYIRS